MPHLPTPKYGQPGILAMQTAGQQEIKHANGQTLIPIIYLKWSQILLVSYTESACKKYVVRKETEHQWSLQHFEWY